MKQASHQTQLKVMNAVIIKNQGFMKRVEFIMGPHEGGVVHLNNSDLDQTDLDDAGEITERALEKVS